MTDSRVRVIRVLEYDYPDQETCEKDMARWGVPPNGVRHGWGPNRPHGVVVRSATTFPETMPHEEPEFDDRTPPKTDFPNELTHEQQVAVDMTNVENPCRAIVDRQGRREPCGYPYNPDTGCTNMSNHVGADDEQEEDLDDTLF